MSGSIFNGDVMVPGEPGRGLAASLTLAAGEVTLTTESDVLGTWSAGEYEVQPTEGSEFRLTLGIRHCPPARGDADPAERRGRSS